MSRPSRALVDLSALRHNYREAKRLHGRHVLAVLKANAYGHGAVACARALETIADGFAVAFVDEALVLRESGISAPIVVLEGAFNTDEMLSAIREGLWMVVHDEAQLRMIETTPSWAHDLRVWLKIDTGMRRVGFPLPSARKAYERLQQSGRVAEIVLMTHLACAEQIGADFTNRQINAFVQATAGLRGPRSIANSAGLMAWPNTRADWGRAGIMLYGASSSDTRLLAPDRDISVPDLRAVMTLKSQVFATRALAEGDSVGYGAAFTATSPMLIGLVAIGYADGYPRNANLQTPIQVSGHRSRVIGRVSMDMLAVDLTHLPGVGTGSEVELWGSQVAVDQVAGSVGTIGYELLCNVKRVPLVYG